MENIFGKTFELKRPITERGGPNQPVIAIILPPCVSKTYGAVKALKVVLG